jgi:hypothetical protein
VAEGLALTPARSSLVLPLRANHGGTTLCLEARDLHVSIAGLVSASQPLMDLAATVIAVRKGGRPPKVQEVG